MATALQEVDVCLEFAFDYVYIIPFLVHYLGLGTRRVWIYNNDRLPWERHETIQCLVSRELVSIIPYSKEVEGLQGLNHCFKTSIPSISAEPLTSASIWGARVDVDEFLVLHEHKCLPAFLQSRATGAYVIPWALFGPAYPLDRYSRTGHATDLPADAKGIILPHMLVSTRVKINHQVKTIARLSCLSVWKSNHYPLLLMLCPYSTMLQDAEGHKIAPASSSMESTYRIAQLNHYYSLSLSDYLRKSHRGYNRSGWSLETMYPSSRNFLILSKKSVVQDDSLRQLYGSYFDSVVDACHECFSLNGFPRYDASPR